MGRRGFGMVSAVSEIYRLQGRQNEDHRRLRSWQYAARRLAELVSAGRNEDARELAGKVTAANMWYGAPFEVPENWN